jgi:hypothetical protein
MLLDRLCHDLGEEHSTFADLIGKTTTSDPFRSHTGRVPQRYGRGRDRLSSLQDAHHEAQPMIWILTTVLNTLHGGVGIQNYSREVGLEQASWGATRLVEGVGHEPSLRVNGTAAIRLRESYEPRFSPPSD